MKTKLKVYSVLLVVVLVTSVCKYLNVENLQRFAGCGSGCFGLQVS